MKDDGVIYISIDDHEQSNLKKICDEIFGEENFIANIIWEKKYSPQNDAKWFSATHDHIILYAKNKSIWRPRQSQRTDEANARYKNPDNDPRGDWKMSDLSVKTYSPDYDYPITTPSGKVVTLPKGRCWMTNKTRMEELIKDNRIWFGANGENVPALKRFLSEVKDGITPMTIWYRKDVGDNQEGKQELVRIIPENVFQTPKVVRLIKKAIYHSNANTNDLILDFFAGSGTTAHAVMSLNADDGGSRKLSQYNCPKSTDEKSEAYIAGYQTIAEITKERIRRAGASIKMRMRANIDFSQNKLDTGFRVFKLDSSNIQSWDTSVEEFEGQLDMFAENNGDHIKSNRTEEDVLFEILLKYGLELTLPIEEKVIEDCKIYNIGFGSMYICLSDNIKTDVAIAIGEWHKESSDSSPSVIF